MSDLLVTMIAQIGYSGLQVSGPEAGGLTRGRCSVWVLAAYSMQL
jgi:hypothetical protein